jgi:hypothetical protein
VDFLVSPFDSYYTSCHSCATLTNTSWTKKKVLTLANDHKPEIVMKKEALKLLKGFGTY